MIHDFAAWSGPRAEVCPFSELADTTLAIDASFYLERLIRERAWREPLLSALGGLPFAMQGHIRKELTILRDANITPIFVFPGLDSAEKYRPFDERAKAAAANAQAWTLYAQHQPEEAVEAFGKSGYAQPEHLYRFLQSILHAEGVDFQVAPYTAWGQLAYLSKQPDRYVDAIAGSSELLLFDVERFISHLDFEKQQFTFVRQQSCQEELATTSPEMFIDACLLSGNALLPTLPLLAHRRPPPKTKTVVDMMKGAPGQNAVSLCLANQENPQMKEQDYLKRYMRSRLAVKHQIIMSAEGKIVVPEQQDLPGDMDAFLGLQLPDEVYYYLSLGAIGPRILNQLTSKAIYETTPVDGGESQAYRTLVSEKLIPIRRLTLAVLGNSLHKGYWYTPIKLNTWFNQDPDKAAVLKIVEEQPKPAEILNTWNVHEDIFSTVVQTDDNTLASALQALADPAFASKTITTKSKSSPKLLETKSELTMNTIWRFLHLQKYVDDKHNLTPWGNVLSTILSNLGPSAAPESAAVIATELLRYDLLSSDEMFPTYSGGPRGSETDRRNCLLISRIACLGKLQHESIGFTGPLSRHVLGYTSVINAVNTSLRDLIEVSLVSLLLSGDATRERDDLTDVSLHLPFLLPYNCALGIAMKHYLDEMPVSSGAPTQEVKDSLMEKGKREWLLNAKDVKGDIEKMFCLWDAIYEGIKVGISLGLLKDKDKWDALDSWVKERR